MLYSDLYLFPQIPTFVKVLFGIFVTVLLGSVVYFVGNHFGLFSFETRKPVEIERQELVNLSSYQAGVFWESEEPERGSIQYGTSPRSLNQKAYDERDISSQQNEYTLHYVPLKGLQPNTTYHYKILTERGVVLAQDGKPFWFKTPPDSSALSQTTKTAYGKVSLPIGEAADEAFVFFYYKDTVPKLALTKPTGEFLIPLNEGVNKKDGSTVSYGLSDEAVIEIYHTDNLFSKIDVRIENASPIPRQIVLGNTYAFLEKGSSGTVLSSRSERQSRSKRTDNTIEVTFPRVGAVIPGLQPLVKGFALPNNQVNVTISSSDRDQHRFQARADEDGAWDVRVPFPLNPGTNLLVMQTIDEDGQQVTIKRYFALTPQGQQVLGDATGSAELSPTEQPRPTRRPTVADTSPSPRPTRVILTPTPVIEDETPPQIVTQEPTPVVLVTQVPEPPVAGFIDTAFVLVTAVFVLIGFGIVFLV